MLIKIFLIFLMLTFSLKTEEIPIIVIAPSKQAQSISTVGSSVTVFTEEDLENSTEIFLQDVINYGAPGMTVYQSGGAGTQSGVQLRDYQKGTQQFTLMESNNLIHQQSVMIIILTI